MGGSRPRQRGPTIGDEAVRARTGRDWAGWFRLLDRAGARAMDHRQIVALLARGHELSGWWKQTIAVAYEQSRGLRDVHEKPSGYEIGRSKTLGVPVGRAWAAWADEKLRRRWLRDAGFVVRKATDERSLRVTWIDGTTHVSVMFWVKGPSRCLVQVQHGKLPGAAAARRMKTYWGLALQRLKEQLEA